MASMQTSPSRLVKLSAIISRNSNILNSYLVEKRLSQPSFAVDAPPDGIVISKDEPRKKELERARKELITATKELHDLSVGGRESIRNLAWTFNDQLSLQYVHENKIAKAFGPNETTTFSDLAAKTNTPLHDLKRLVRHAITTRIFAEPRKNVLAHTPSSLLLHSDAPTQAWVGMVLQEFWPASTRVVEAMRKWPGSGEPTHTGLSVALGEEKHLFQVVGSSPERMARFGAAMASLSQGEGFEVGHLVGGYDWGQFEKGRERRDDGEEEGGLVVDVGGSFGHVTVALAQAYPGLRFVVQDLEKVYRGVDLKAKVPEEVRDRIEFLGQDFFEEQKVKGADVYLIRWCLHNWSDKYAVKILRALVPALKKGARIVINDGVLPEPKALGASWKSSAELSSGAEAVAEATEGDGVVGEAEEVDAEFMDARSMRIMDLVMLQGLNARERDVDEWRELFKRADERFIWKGAWQPEGCKMWIIEAEWAG